MENPKIIFEDNSFFVLYKPAGWITNDADTTTDQPVLQTWVRNNFDYELKGSVEFRDGIVHRLDKETSGILLIAKNEKAFTSLQSQFKERIVKKTYLTLVHGKVVPIQGEISASVGRLPWRRDRFGVLPGGRNARTDYKVIKYYTTGSEIFSFMEMAPQTGRTHQIRIHLKYLGFPIVADNFYAGRKRSKKDREWCKRLFLHAHTIEFNHPQTGNSIKFESELPEDLVFVLAKLKDLS